MESLPPQRQPFRPNLAVFRMLAIVFVALALPIATILLAFRDWAPAKGSPPPEISALRESVEVIAADRLGAPRIEDARREISFSGSEPEVKARRTAIEAAARTAGATVISSDGALLLSVPSDSAMEFEAALGVAPPGSGAFDAGADRLYRFTFP
jgi:hypothetical protein